MPRPYFYKLVLSSTIQAKQLRIPDNFVRKIRDELSAVATLAVPVGHIWHVGLRKADNKFWFREGWQEFVDHYAIRVGYFLLFKYEGNSSFVVYIFNLSTSEINYQSANLRNSQAFKYCNQNAVFEEIEDDDSGDIAGSSLPSLISERNKAFSEGSDQLRSSKNFNPPALQNLFNGSKLNCINWSDEGSAHPSKEGRNLMTDIQSIRNSGVLISHSESKKIVDGVKQEMVDEDVQKLKNVGRKKRKMDDEQGPSIQNEEEVEIRYRFYESASARKRTVTAEERERVVSASKAYEPINPFCRVVLRPSYLYRGCIMYLPSCFAEKNLSMVSGFIKLQISDGRQWPVRCLNKGGKTKFSQGWYEFCLENNLGEGDVCVFELIKAREIVLKVTMFRVMEDARCANPTPLQSYSHSKLAKMATASAAFSPAMAAASSVTAPRKTKRNTHYIAGLNSFSGLKARTQVASSGVPVCTQQSFAKVVSSLKGKGRGGGGALSSTCDTAGEIFQVAAIINGLVLVGVAVGFVLLRIEAAVEEAD